MNEGIPTKQRGSRMCHYLMSNELILDQMKHLYNTFNSIKWSMPGHRNDIERKWINTQKRFCEQADTNFRTF